jgi:phthiocerol/phenolphthiocerol synthesis type-I polyketide synthase E
MRTPHQYPLAVIGMACVVPGANDYEAYWAKLGDDTDASGSMPACRTKPTIENAELFDAGRYGISDHEALIMDPQCRQFLMLVDSAFSDAGYGFGNNLGRVGVVASEASNGTYHDYLASLVAQQLIPPLPALLEAIHRGSDFLATRVSYAFDLKGPSFNLQSGCSSSLVAVAEACHLIWSGRCDVAVAGGMTITYPLGGEYEYEPGSIYSKTGICRPFDSRADGTVPAGGGGVVVLKPLSQAIESGDRIHCVVRGAGVNNDGASKVSFAAPAVDGQYALLRDAYACAGIDASRLAFVECHATGTAIGDPIEVRALQRFIESHASIERTVPIFLGSVKGHIGHLFWSSGVLAMIKSVLALKHGVYPGTAGLNTLNPLLVTANSPFSIGSSATRLNLDKHDCGGVSSFGVGGTNAHVILEHHFSGEAARPRAAQPALELRHYSLVPEPSTVEMPGGMARTHTPVRRKPDSRAHSIGALIEVIGTAYEEVLGETGITATSNYFDLHGDSISAVLLIAQLQAHYGVTLAQEDIYRCPTPATLAQFLSERLDNMSQNEEPPVYLNDFQVRFFLLEKIQRGSFSHYNVPLCLSSDVEPDWARFCATLDGLLREIPAFSRCLKWVSARIVLTGDRQQVMSCEQTTLVSSENAEPHFTEFFGRRFDIESGVSARAMYLRQDRRHHIAISFPHLLIDGSGLENLLRRLERMLEGEIPPLPDLVEEAPVWSEADKLYWRELLQDVSPSTFSDEIKPSASRFEPDDLRLALESAIVLPEDLLDSARAICRERKMTLFVLFYAIFNTLLARRTAERRIVSGTTMSNRDSNTIDHIDCRITNVPICLEIEDAQDCEAIFEHTRERLAAATKHATAPLNEIVQAAGCRGAPYRILFIFQNQNSGYRMRIDGQLWREGDFRYKPLYAELSLQFGFEETGQLGLVMHADSAYYTQSNVDQLLVEFITVGREFVRNVSEAPLHA